MFKKGKPKTGGRKKGVQNKNPLRDKAEELGIDPFEVLLYFAAGNWKALKYDAEKQITYSKDYQNEEYTISPAVRAKAAGEACQYMYPKLKAIDHSIQTSDGEVKTVILLPMNGRESNDDQK